MSAHDAIEQTSEMRRLFPAHLLPCFAFQRMNRVQQQVLPAAFTSEENLLVCAPTGNMLMSR